MMNLLILQLSGIVTDTTVHYTANTYGTVVVHALMLTFYMFSFVHHLFPFNASCGHGKESSRTKPEHHPQ